MVIFRGLLAGARAVCARPMRAMSPPLPPVPLVSLLGRVVGFGLGFPLVSRCRKLTQNPYRCTGKSLCARPRCGAVGGLYPPGVPGVVIIK